MRALALCLLTVALSGCGHGSRAPAAEEPVATVAPVPTDLRVPEECSTTWVGPRAGGDWDDPGNWSGHRAPGGGDQACIARGRRPVIAHGTHEVGSIVAAGGLEIARDGGIDLVDASTTSLIGDVVARGTFQGSSSVIVVNMRLGNLFHSTRGEGESSGPALIPCGPHRPAGVTECRDPVAAHAPDPAERRVAAAWRRFSDLVVAAVADDTAANRRAVAALHDHPADVPRLLRLFDAGGFPNRLGPVRVRGRRARSAYVDFARHGDAWHILRVRGQYPPRSR